MCRNFQSELIIFKKFYEMKKKKIILNTIYILKTHINIDSKNICSNQNTFP